MLPIRNSIFHDVAVSSILHFVSALCRWIQNDPRRKLLLLERGGMSVSGHPGKKVWPRGEFDAEAYLLVFTESELGYRRRMKREAKVREDNLEF